MKTALKEAIVLSATGKKIKKVPVTNPCNMWKAVKELFKKHGDTVEIQVTRADGTLFMDLTQKPLKNGKYFVKETRRKRKLTEEELKAQKLAEKKAKKAA